MKSLSLLGVCALLCFTVRTSLATVTFMEATQEMRDWCAERHCNPMESYDLVVGETIMFNITAIHNQRSQNATIAVLSNPGLPNEAHLTGVVMLNFSVDENRTVHWAAQRHLTFTPTANQEGLTFQVCFNAFNVDNQADATQLCIPLHVKAPVPTFHVNLTASSEGRLAVGVNCPVVLPLVAMDGGDSGYCMRVHPGRIGAGDQGMPFGAQLRMVSQAASQQRGAYDGCGPVAFEIIWYPRRGLEGASYTLCAHAGDTFCEGNGLRGRVCTERKVERCYHIDVVKCQYCLGAGETIMAAAARYRTDWLQLWAANAHLTTPDTLPAYQPLTLGPTYVVRASDTLQSLSMRFGTTASNILDANPDVDLVNNVASLEVGDEICILPWVCLTEQESYAAGAYIANQ
mmetsp:Transcript_39599/g.93758  ORF Transcript_39599/g.93758 Transcript_39599/m.93758 type:complete len:402 (+) Transcript_39599:247-1452(+)